MPNKHRQHTKTHQTNRVGSSSSISVDPETPNQFKEQMEPLPPLEVGPSYEEIQRRAYQIHEEKGGSDLENWLEAESSLKEEQHAHQG